MSSRLLTPGFSSGSNRISRPVSVTADLIRLTTTAGSSSSQIAPLTPPRVLLICLSTGLQVIDLGRLLHDVRLRHPERVAVLRVEPLREVPRELEVLALVGADGDLIGLVQQDVRRHEDRVVEQPDADDFVTCALVLELRHPAGLAIAGEAAQHPGQLGVLADVALHEERAALGVHATGEVLRRGDPGAPAQLLGVGLDRQRMQVDDAVEGVVGLLERHPLHQRPEVVPEMQAVGGRLHAREDARPVE